MKRRTRLVSLARLNIRKRLVNPHPIPLRHSTKTSRHNLKWDNCNSITWFDFCHRWVLGCNLCYLEAIDPHGPKRFPQPRSNKEPTRSRQCFKGFVKLGPPISLVRQGNITAPSLAKIPIVFVNSH
jgi:hypothetical protein